MKRIVPIWLLLCIGMILVLFGGGSLIYNQRNDVQFEEIAYVGDLKVLDGISVELSSREKEFKQNSTLNFQDGLKWESEFKSLYYTKETYEPDEGITLSTNPMSVIYDRERAFYNQPGVYRYKVRDYFTFLPIEFSLSAERKSLSTKSESSDLFQITVPESAEFEVEIGNSGSTSIRNINIPWFSFNLPAVKIGNQYYFTISNLTLENGWYENNENVEYRGTSGILMFDTIQYANWDIPINYAINVLFPIEIDSEKQVIVLNLSKVTEKEYLALTVLEESTLYLYLYDVKNDKLITKTNVGEIPKNAIIKNLKYVEQGDFLLANYYLTIDTLNEDPTYELICAVYKVTKEDKVEICINQNYVRKLEALDPTLLNIMKKGYPTLDLVDMYYYNNSLYMLFRNFNDINLIAVNTDDIIYAGTIQSLTDYGLKNVKFVH